MPDWVDSIFGKGGTDMAGVGAGIGGAAAGLAGVAAAPVALAGAAGGAIGNAIAPSVFGDMNTQGTHYEEVPADGKFKPSTGNQYVDAAVNGVGSAADWAKNLF